MMVATKHAAILVNPRSGVSGLRVMPEHIRSLLSGAGLDTSLSIIGQGQNAVDLVRDAIRQGHDTVVACGGDGTVSAVASVLAGTDAVLGVMPLGTLNHFAKDLHIPHDLHEAAQVIARGNVKSVDVAEVNGRVFVNNSSLGIYPNIVIDRERRRRTGLNKWVALGLATLHVMRLYPFVDVRIVAKGDQITQRTPFVFLGNNEYEITGLNIGRRNHLDLGRLYLYVAAPVSRIGLVGLAIAALLGNLNHKRGLQMFSAGEAWIQTARKSVRVSADGEVLHLTTPLHYRLRPLDLRVIVP